SQRSECRETSGKPIGDWGGVARAGNAAWFQVRVNLLIMSIRKTTILLRQAALSVRRIVKSG
ncbi:MAG: hypothetical protein PVF10_09885, partial [Syntrophobacterales bacterium]